MDKNYIEKQYRLAVLQFRTARSEDEQWQARRSMAKLEAVASEIFGFDYADSLKEKLW